MTRVALLASGRLSRLSPDLLASLLDRGGGESSELSDDVAALLADVASRGDVALREMAQRFDGVTLDVLEVPRAEWEAALVALDPAVRSALERADRNITSFHAAQRPQEVVFDVEPGVRVTRVSRPLDSVGVYAPGGRAAYPSSVLMGVAPAKALGVNTVIVCSPPSASGRPPTEVLAACAIAGADRLLSVGGAGAIAALTFGTESIPAVDAIVGPGNRWVTEAKRQVAGRVLIDSPAGPSEILVIADASADPTLVALELIAQAEHDPDAACVLVTTSPVVADGTLAALARLIDTAPRAEVVRAAFAKAGAVLTTDSLDEAFAFANRYAPEHLSLMTAGATADARRVTTAGTTFVGASASVAFGDYMTGANHVLPTGGRARSFSGLSAQHFLRSYTIQEITPDGARAMAEDVVRLAEAEGLPGHAAAAAARGNV